ncbi:MAG: sensor domain-containing diguanylate cyclase [Oscillospiraceae bacterium]|jgi:diguanylate cyclase (GGDEF)-like protein
MKNIKSAIFILIAAAAAAAIFTGAFKTTLKDMMIHGEQQQMSLDMVLGRSRNFVRLLSLYGNNFFYIFDPDDGSELFDLISYDAESDTYRLDYSTTGGSLGTLIGQGAPEGEGLKKLEMEMALYLSGYFSAIHEKVPELAWISYMSDNNFLLIYPNVPVDFHYSQEFKSMEAYKVAVSESNPSRQPKWTGAYTDLTGKGPIVTVSGPIYLDHTFLGAVSIGITADALGKHMIGEYYSCLVDSDCTVIAAESGTASYFKNPGDFTEISSDCGQDLLEIQNGTVSRVGMNYYYRSDITEAPWTLLISCPVLFIAGKAALLTLPVIIICVLLLYTLQEIKSRKKAEERIAQLAVTDNLTGLKNRYYLDQVIKEEFDHSKRHKSPLSIIMFDLDNFKQINDTWGHEIGDEVLRQKAEIAQDSIRGSDKLIRLGGEEFLIVLPRTDLNGAYKVAEKLRQSFETLRHPVVGKTTASFGVAQRAGAEDFPDLYRRADEALYKAKENGRSQVVAAQMPDAFRREG